MTYTAAVPFVLGCVLAVAAVTDLRRRKVYNWLTFPAMGLGLAFNVAIHGAPGLWFAGAGLLGGGLLFFPAYLWGGMGAGDIKLMGVIGAFMGLLFVVNTAIYGVFIGAAVGVVVLMLKGELGRTLNGIFRFLYTAAHPRLATEALPKNHPVPFALFLMAGAAAAYVLPPWIVW